MLKRAMVECRTAFMTMFLFHNEKDVSAKVNNNAFLWQAAIVYHRFFRNFVEQQAPMRVIL